MVEPRKALEVPKVAPIKEDASFRTPAARDATNRQLQADEWFASPSSRRVRTLWAQGALIYSPPAPELSIPLFGTSRRVFPSWNRLDTEQSLGDYLLTRRAFVR